MNRYILVKPIDSSRVLQYLDKHQIHYEKSVSNSSRLKNWDRFEFDDLEDYEFQDIESDLKRLGIFYTLRENTMNKRVLLENKLRKLIRQEISGNQNELDNRLYLALKDLASLSAYLSDPKKPITNSEVSKFRNELRRRYKVVDDAIGQYAK